MKRNICRIKIDEGRVSVVYEPSEAQPRQARARFDHKKALASFLQKSSTLSSEDFVQDGQKLFKQLLLSDQNNPNAYTIFERSFDAQERGLQLRLEIMADFLPQLLELPWEKLHDLVYRPLALDKRVPDYGFVRSLLNSGKEPSNTLPIYERPRILIVVANPSDMEAVSFHDTVLSFQPIESQRRLQETLALDTLFRQLQIDGRIAKFDVLRGEVLPNKLETSLLQGYPTLMRINQVLAAAELAGKPYHVLHFLAHGYVDDQGRGYLLLTNEEGAAELVSEDKFQNLFPRQHQLRLVVLAACQSDDGQQRSNQPLSGLAPAFLQTGIPSVIAMQTEITVVAARVFTQKFYESLMQSGLIDSAVLEARLAIDLANTGRTEWFTPVLYMQGDDPRLFVDDKSSITRPSKPQKRQEREMPTLVSQTLQGIPASVLIEIRIVLLGIEFLESDTQLRSIFVDDRLRPWVYGLPQANSIDVRVSQIINYLHNKYSDQNENGLLLLLQVLQERMDVRDQRYTSLEKVINSINQLAETEGESPESMANLTPTAERILRKKISQYFAMYELKTVAFDLGIDWGNLQATGNKPDAVRSLIIYAKSRDGLFDQLMEILRVERPHVDW